LLRERQRVTAAAEEYGRAYERVKNRYESLSNKFALSLMELKRLDEAQKVLEGSLLMHPGSGTTHVYLGRLALLRKDWPRARTEYREALAVDPFNPEVQLALYRAADALHDKGDAERTRHAAAVLTGLPEEKIGAIASSMLGENPVEVSVPPLAADAVSAPVDAGITQQKNPANAPLVR
jgi:tetratricopeptide (TPR) repeat protein